MDASNAISVKVSQPRMNPMAEDLRQSFEQLRAAADTTRALAVQMAELLKLREEVQSAEEATASKRRNQHHRVITSAAYPARADVPGVAGPVKRCLVARRGSQVFSKSVVVVSDLVSLEHHHDAPTRNGIRKRKALPGRLFMQSQWR
jgi:hypothetical protein